MSDYYATTQVSINTAEKGEARQITYLPPFKKADEGDWKEALGEDQFEAFVKEGVLVKVKEDDRIDQEGFIHFQRIGVGSSVVDDPNAPPDEDVAKALDDDEVEAAKSQRGEGTGQPPGLGTVETPTDETKDEKSLEESGTVTSQDAVGARAEETATKTGQAAKPAVTEKTKPATPAKK